MDKSNPYTVLGAFAVITFFVAAAFYSLTDAQDRSLRDELRNYSMSKGALPEEISAIEEKIDTLNRTIAVQEQNYALLKKKVESISFVSGTSTSAVATTTIDSTTSSVKEEATTASTSTKPTTTTRRTTTTRVTSAS